MIITLRKIFPIFVLAILLFITQAGFCAQDARVEPYKKLRARDLGIIFNGIPGKLNAITDVKGVQVGQVTLISGKGKLAVGKGPVRTGVTVIFPRGKKDYASVFAACWALNGAGELTGAAWIDESGLLDGPIGLTNTNSVGVVRDSIVEWQYKNNFYIPDRWPTLAVAGETWDGFLIDIVCFHIKKEHVFAALDSACGGAVTEGGVGGGTGMVCYQFKGGIGTASRVLSAKDGGYTVGVLVQANHGKRKTLMISGVPVGQCITDLMPVIKEEKAGGTNSSIIVIVATNAPLAPHQLKRIAKRVSLGLARTGGMGLDSSGDIFLAFSTANTASTGTLSKIELLSNEQMDPLFEATVFATEEAIVNALVAGQTMSGINGNTVYGIPHDKLKAILAQYKRINN